MPRRHRRASEASSVLPRPVPSTPAWAQAPGFEVRRVGGDKAYRCPGCDHPIRPGVWHLVAVPAGQSEARRHWHTECWRRELRRRRLI